MKNLFAVFITFFFLQSSYAQITHVSGVMASDTIWDSDSIQITDEFIVPNGLTLTINPGCVILGNIGKGIYVRGTLLALGEENNKITFTASDTSGFYGPDSLFKGWGGIYFDLIADSNDSSIVDHVEMSFGKAFGNTVLEQSGGAILIFDTRKIRISNSRFHSSKAQRIGGGIAIYFESRALVYNNLIENNYSLESAGGIYCGYTSAVWLLNNRIIKNTAYQVNSDGSYAGSGGGVYIISETTKSYIINNLIANNYATTGAGMYDLTFDILTAGNIMVNNQGKKGGIVMSSPLSAGVFINNTVYNNIGVGVQYASDEVKFINNIVRNNYDDFLEHELNFSGNPVFPGIFEHNNVELGKSYETFIDEEPLFVNPSAGKGIAYPGYEANWSLKYGDPNIDQGTLDGIDDLLPKMDYYNNLRVLNDLVDIGAVEFDILLNSKDLASSRDLKVYPNPFHSQFVIADFSDIHKGLTFEIYNVKGVLMVSFSDPLKVPDLSNLAVGNYYLVCISTNGEILGRALIVKN
ncbi:MAG: right-handed parallel beta-helix repeat-containing protein [Saprospiraceae bacterium]